MLAAREIAGELRHGLDPVAFAIERLRFEPDPWQAKVLRSSSRRRRVAETAMSVGSKAALTE